MKRVNHLYEKLISDENLIRAIDEVNKGHHLNSHHRPRKMVTYIEAHKEETVLKLRSIIEEGFVQNEPRKFRRYDQSSLKWRKINMPKLFPDQYIHHALIQVLEPVMMRGMDRYCCGSIKGRGTHYGVKAISKWMHADRKGTKYCLEMDIRHFYENLSSDIVMNRLRELIKDRKVLCLCESILSQGVPIGFYTSQWFANTALQPLDEMIRQSGYCEHYVRYMDNFTIFGGNKRKLHKLKDDVAGWLHEHGLEVKDNWQVYRTAARPPNAMGYRFYFDRIFPRKRNRLRLIRQINKCLKKICYHRKISRQLAAGLLSRLGQMRHCCHNYFYAMYLPNGVQKILKEVSREHITGYRNALQNY